MSADDQDREEEKKTFIQKVFESAGNDTVHDSRQRFSFIPYIFARFEIAANIF